MSDLLTPNALTPRAWEDKDWESVIYPIRHGQCTPFLGAGASAGVLPLGRTLAKEWAIEYKYPFKDWRNLSRVAQYVAVEVESDLALKLKLKDVISGAKAGGAAEAPLPDFNNPDEPHRVMAEFDLPVYITTNYDNFMVKALEHVGKKSRKEVCQWYKVETNAAIRQVPGASGTPDLRELKTEPIVYHLHGDIDEVRSMVLTEDDYLDFLINIEQAIPTYIRAAFANSTLLFIGYSLEDINFRVLFRGLGTGGGQLGRHISVQLPPEVIGTRRGRLRAEKQLSYLQQHFQHQKVKVFWGTAEQFTRELRRRV